MATGLVERLSGEIILCRAQKAHAVARYAGRCPGPRQGSPPETPAPFPFCAMIRNGPRPQGCATENLFKGGKDFLPPRTNRAPLTAAGRSEDLTVTRERGLMQSRFAAPRSLPLVGLGTDRELATKKERRPGGGSLPQAHSSMRKCYGIGRSSWRGAFARLRHTMPPGSSLLTKGALAMTKTTQKYLKF